MGRRATPNLHGPSRHAASKSLKATSRRFRARRRGSERGSRPWTGSSRRRARPASTRIPKRASPSYRRRREKRPRAEAAPRAEEPPPREPAERDDDDDVVVTGERSAEEARAPRDVVDLTSDEPLAKRVKAEPAPRPLATFDDGESDAPLAPLTPRGPPPRSALKKASSSSRKSARFADAPDAAPGAAAGDAAARPAAVEPEAHAAEQKRVLEKRMDRAIWDAFKSKDFAPLEALLANGADAAHVRAAAGGETALMAAAYAGRDDLCRLLLAAGADPAHADNHGATAAYLARGKNHGTLAALLEGVSLNPALAAAAAAPAPPAVAASPRKPPRAGDERHPSTLPPEDRGDDAPRPAEDDVSTRAALSPEDRAIVGAA